MKAVFLLLLLAGAMAEITEDQGVLVFDDSNYKEGIKTHSKLLLEFYAPWCGHCQQLEPEYYALAQRLKENESTFRIAKINADENAKAME